MKWIFLFVLIYLTVWTEQLCVAVCVHGQNRCHNFDVVVIYCRRVLVVLPYMYVFQTWQSHFVFIITLLPKRYGRAVVPCSFRRKRGTIELSPSVHPFVRPALCGMRISATTRQIYTKSRLLGLSWSGNVQRYGHMPLAPSVDAYEPKDGVQYRPDAITQLPLDLFTK